VPLKRKTIIRENDGGKRSRKHLTESDNEVKNKDNKSKKPG